jgi:hypothetical protein
MHDRESIAKHHRAALAPQLDAIVRAGKVADRSATMTFDWPTGPAAPDFTETGEAIIVLRDDLDAGDRALPVRLVPLDDDPYRVARWFLGGPGMLKYPKLTVYEPLLGQIERARYALVIVMHEATPAFADGAGHFTAGQVSAAGLLVELASAELRGAFEFTARSSGEVDSRRGLMDSALREDLSMQFQRALVAALVRRFPDARPPETFAKPF